MAFSRILVPVGGIPADEQAIRLACQVARQDKAKITAIHVIEVQRNLPLNAEDAAQMERGESVLARAEQIAKAARGSLETELLQARVAGSALVDEAGERGIDLIIMGIPDRKPLGDFYLGATTLYVLKNAACRVWLCREGRREDQPAARKEK
jgi:nucleotide-binding universal stress UspA family protein